MKKYPILFLVSMVIGLTGMAQSKSDSLLTVKAMNTIIQLSKAGEHGKAAGLIVYTGKDTTQLFKVVSDYRKKEHRDLVDDFCLDIKEFLVDCVSKKIEAYYTDTDDDGTWHILEMTCVYENNKKKKFTIEFLKIKGKLLLGGLTNNYMPPGS